MPRKPLLRASSALPRAAAASLLALNLACTPAEETRVPGPEIPLRQWEEQVEEDGELALELLAAPSQAPGHVEGRLFRGRLCQGLVHQEVSRTDQVQTKASAGVGTLLVGIGMAAVGTTLVATAPLRRGTPRGDARTSPRTRSFIAGGVGLAWGVPMATWSGVELIRGREREVTETYQVSQRVGEASPCGQAPVAEAKIWFSVDSLPMTRSYAATTDEIGHFSFDLMSITDGLVPSVDADDEARELLLEQGIHFPVAKQSTLTLSVEYEVGDLKPVEIDLGDWFSEPARRIAVACNPPQPATACEQVVAELRDEHAATPHALAFLALLALTLSQEMQGTYKGARREGRRHGKGTATYAGGRRYEGQWKEGWREGRGSYKDPERSLEYVGMWKQGRRQGKGLQTTPDYRYEGQFEADQISGQGTMTYASGIKHRGQFKDGVPMGRGVRTRPNGLMLEAEYDDQTIVTGKNARVQWPSGVVWEGAWNDTLSGGHYSFTNPHRRSASELYVQAGRLLDEGEIDHAKLILRFVAKSNPGSEAARRSVDRLAVLRQSEKETAREQEQREAEQEALARREAEEREQAQEAARAQAQREHEERLRLRRERNKCMAACEGLSRDGFASPWGKCRQRCEAIW